MFEQNSNMNIGINMQSNNNQNSNGHKMAMSTYEYGQLAKKTKDLPFETLNEMGLSHFNYTKLYK